MKKTLLLILIPVLIMLLSFIGFVANWDPEERPTISALPPIFFGFENIPGGVSHQRCATSFDCAPRARRAGPHSDLSQEATA